MSPTTYNTLTGLLLGSSLLALVLAVAFLIAAVVGWKGPHRKARLYLSCCFLVLFPTLIGAQRYLQWGIYMPLLREAGEKELLARQQEQFSASTNVAVGDAAPEFEVTDIDGNRFSVNGATEKVLLINFFATWCGPCLLELPRMQDIWERHGKNEQFSMLVVGREESEEACRDFRIKHAFTFPIAADPAREVFSLFAKESIPRIFLVSSDGKILYATLGYNEQELDRLDKLLTDLLR